MIVSGILRTLQILSFLTSLIFAARLLKISRYGPVSFSVFSAAIGMLGGLIGLLCASKPKRATFIVSVVADAAIWLIGLIAAVLIITHLYTDVCVDQSQTINSSPRRFSPGSFDNTTSASKAANIMLRRDTDHDEACLRVLLVWAGLLTSAKLTLIACIVTVGRYVYNKRKGKPVAW